MNEKIVISYMIGVYIDVSCCWSEFCSKNIYAF